MANKTRITYIAAGVILPFLMQPIVITIIRLLLRNRSPFTVAALDNISFVAVPLIGFFFLTNRLRLSQRLLAALVYFPVMAVALFYESLVTVGLVFGESL
jgi:hypothetical protein